MFDEEQSKAAADRLQAAVMQLNQAVKAAEQTGLSVALGIDFTTDEISNLRPIVSVEIRRLS